MKIFGRFTTQRNYRRLMLVCVAVTAMILGFHLLTSEDQNWFGHRRQPNDHEVTNGNILLEKDILNLTNLLQQKVKDMEMEAVLTDLGTQRKCTSTEEQNSRCIDPNCPFTFVPRVSPQNIQSIRKPVTRVGTDTLKKAVDAFAIGPEVKQYIFLTAASYNHFHESKTAFESLRANVLPYISNYSVYYYDLGLTNAQRNHVRSTFGVTLRDFPFDSFPARLRYLNCYTWKPLIVQAHIRNAEIVIWFDASIRFHMDMKPIFLKAKKTGFLVTPNIWHFPQHVHLKMFSYFGDDPCQFSIYEEIEANFMIFHNEPFIRRLLVEPWSACALDPTCMCPDETMSLFSCPSGRKYGKCHRFDQATIGYILIKLFRRSIASVYLPYNQYHVVERSKWYEVVRNHILTFLGIN